MSDASTLDENNSGADLAAGTRDINIESVPKTTPSFEECVGRLGIPQPDGSPIQIDETNQHPGDKEIQRQQQQYEVVRSSEEANDTMAVPTLRPSSSSSVSSSTSSTSSPSTTPSSISPSSSKSSGTFVPLDHPGVVVEKAAGEDMFAVDIGQGNNAATSSMPSFDLLEDVEANVTLTSLSSSTSLPEVTFRVPTSTSAINIQDKGHDHESYGLLSLLRPCADATHSLSVRFAPLPELAPRKRKSSIPLGMAARSQLARRRRMYQGALEVQDPYRRRLFVPADAHPDGRNGEVDSAEIRMVKKKMLDKLMKEEEQELEEDSLVVLAKKMGSAGKHLWKKMVAQKANRGDISSLDEQRAAPSEVTAGQPASRTVSPVTLPPLLEQDEENIDRLDEKPPVWKRNKFQLHKPQAPILPS